MNNRITQFERLWATRPPLPRIMAFEPEPELRMPQACWLQRQTNEHERLSPGKKEQWRRAKTQVERDALMATLSPIDLHMPLSDVYHRLESSVEPEPIELDEIEMTEELAALMASWPVRTDGDFDTEVTEAPSEDRLYALIAAAQRMIVELEPETIVPPAPLTAPLLTDGPPLVRTITDIGPGPELQRSTNEHERLRPDLRDRFWSADAEEKAELLATLSPIESSFPGLPALPITAEVEIMRSLR